MNKKAQTYSITKTILFVLALAIIIFLLTVAIKPSKRETQSQPTTQTLPSSPTPFIGGESVIQGAKPVVKTTTTEAIEPTTHETEGICINVPESSGEDLAGTTTPKFTCPSSATSANCPVHCDFVGADGQGSCLPKACSSIGEENKCTHSCEWQQT